MTQHIDEHGTKPMSDEALDVLLSERAFEDSAPDLSRRIMAQAACIEPVRAPALLQKVLEFFSFERKVGASFASFAFLAVLAVGMYSLSGNSVPGVMSASDLDDMIYDDLELAFAETYDIQDTTLFDVDDAMDDIFVDDFEDAFL